MFNDERLRNIYLNADESQFRLGVGVGFDKARRDNKAFEVDKTKARGDKLHGHILLNKLPGNMRQLDLRNSLEVCCGNGFLFFSLMEFCKWDFSSNFVDISMDQIKDFLKQCYDLKPSPPQLLVGDVLELPYPDESFDLVYGNSFLHHLPDLGVAFKEFFRILRPGGLFISFHEPTHSAPTLENIPARLKQIFFQRALSDSLADIWLFKPAALLNFVKSSGFSTVCTMPQNFLSSFLVSPIQTFMGELGFPRHNKIILFWQILCDRLDRFFPLQLRRHWAPSLAIIATK